MSFATARSVSIGATPVAEVYYGALKLWPTLTVMLSFTEFPPWAGLATYNALRAGEALEFPPWGAAQAFNSTLLAEVSPSWEGWQLFNKSQLASAVFPPWDGWVL